MTKKYLVNETEKWAAEKLTGRPMDAKEVEVLDDKQVNDEYQKSQFLGFTDYLKANKYLIVKIIE